VYAVEIPDGDDGALDVGGNGIVQPEGGGRHALFAPFATSGPGSSSILNPARRARS
jgi:hypothetical protein